MGIQTGILIANFLTIVVVAVQTYEARRQRKDDHLRRRRQGTIEFYSTLRSSRQALRDAAERIIKRDVMSAQSINQLRLSADAGDEEAGEALQAIENHLAGLEWFAVGVRTGVYDIDIADRLAGSHIIQTAHQFGTFIVDTRQRRNSQTLFSDLEGLAHELRSRRETVNSAGKLPRNV